ncbi:hypothetical protein [Sphingopyxis sp. USTB-05]|uniref:hypothetical protein n=1 Tax=Sphingopyxis sp. USTB-05 TaxID=2830667 RepID=UPI002078FD2D|nr:hypothetical protein [Sphingopyxis sp. USTB-05]USI78724.1 hypothetical protein KEC45_07485 [Sphingopyxis sp. USTB-05]
MSDDAAPAQSALYHLARALMRSGAIQPDDLVDAARAVEREGAKDDPDNEAWDEWAHALRLAALNLDDPDGKPRLGVIEGGKQNDEKADAP